jgi:hypothetical protein
MSIRSDNSPGSVRNFLVPSAGTCSEYRVVGQFTASPWLGDWQQLSVDAAPFQPQGVYIDNSQSTTPVTITFTLSGYSITCPAGCIWHTSFPALNGSKAQVTGSGAGNDVTSLTFVDFPVFPLFLNPAQVAGAQNVVITGFTSATPVNTSGSPLATGNVPYRTQEDVPAVSIYTASITGAATSAAIAPGIANLNLRKLLIYITGDATLAAAGETNISAVLNAVTVHQRKFYLPAAAPAAPAPGFTLCELDGGMFGMNAAGGALNITIANALATGQIDIVAYFTPQ